MPNRYEYSFIAASGVNQELADAARDAGELIGKAADVFYLLGNIITDDHTLASDRGFVATLEMCSRGFASAMDKEGAKLTAIEIMLRQAKREEIEEC